MSKLEKVLGERTEQDTHRQRQDALEAERQQFAQERAQWQTQAKAREQALAQQQAAYEAWRANPVEGSRALGHDPDQVAAELTRAGSPEAVWDKRMRDAEAKAEARAAALEAKIKEQDDRWAQAHQQFEASKKGQAEQAFVVAADPEKYPNARALYETPEELLEASYKVIGALRQKTGGRATCTDTDILEYLEAKAAQKAAKLRGGVSAVGALEGAKGVAAQSQPAKGQRTVSVQDASERRSGSSDIRDLSVADENEQLKAAVRATRKRS